MWLWKDCMKIKLNSDDNLPFNESWKFQSMTIVIGCVFSEGVKLYLQRFLYDSLHELQKCYRTKRLMFQKKLI